MPVPWARPKAAPLQSLGGHISRERITPFEDEDSLPDEAFLPLSSYLDQLAKSGRRVRGRDLQILDPWQHDQIADGHIEGTR